ncbi:phage tail protein (plasmid) [Buttiauxella sp. WJP83]|uniref:phage tail protein n=1 Tax=Buttiauxella sp. WJP83 TaxID=2986951 RepID=UPI0022DD669E|nr:phage tail protein [Buttiauxella sp. WJP83]WBM73006.1 phage tail protein [Buttiauxella sp. WJP83]
MWYREGTITFTQGSNTLTGVGTAWNVTANGVLPGMIVVGPDNRLYEIKRVNNDTNMVLTEAYAGETQTEVPCCIITTYEGDLTQFSARFTALMTRMSADSKTMRGWLTALDDVTLETEDGQEIEVKSLLQIIKEHNENQQWYRDHVDTIESESSKALAAAARSETSAAEALRSQQAAATSESNAAASERASAANQAATSESEAVAKACAEAAKTSETNAESHKEAAGRSEATALSKATEAAESAASAAASKDAAKVSADNAAASKDASAHSATAAADSASKAKTSESNAASSETAAAESAAGALASKGAAQVSETNAAECAKRAAASESAAKSSETNSAASERAAAASEGAAAGSATAAAGSATAAADSATSAEQSSGEALASKDAAASSASEAKTSEANAKASETSASESAASANESKTAAQRSEASASTSATSAAHSQEVAEQAASAAEAAAKRAEDVANLVSLEDATLTTKGVVRLSNETNSESESLAATPKAVKAAMDSANARLVKDQNGADIPDIDSFVRNIGAARAFSAAVDIGDEDGSWTTADFIEWLESQGAFNHPYWMCKGSWSYERNKVITDTGCGNICLAGAVVEVMGTRGAMTIRVTTPNTTVADGVPSAQFTYINHGDGYAPGWRREFKRTGDGMNGQLKIKAIDALKIYDDEYGIIFRRSEGNLYLIPTEKGQGENGGIGPLRPLGISLSDGNVTLGNGVNIHGRTRVNNGIGIGTDSGMGDHSLAIGDNDTGLKWDSDGIFSIWNNAAKNITLNHDGMVIDGSRWAASRSHAYLGQYSQPGVITIDYGGVPGASDYYAGIKLRSQVNGYGYYGRVEFGHLRSGNAQWPTGVILVGSAESSENGHPNAVFTFSPNGDFGSPHDVSAGGVSLRGTLDRANDAWNKAHDAQVNRVQSVRWGATYNFGSTGYQRIIDNGWFVVGLNSTNGQQNASINIIGGRIQVYDSTHGWRDAWA